MGFPAEKQPQLPVLILLDVPSDRHVPPEVAQSFERVRVVSYGLL